MRQIHYQGSHGEEELRERLMGSLCGVKHSSSQNLPLEKRSVKILVLHKFKNELGIDKKSTETRNDGITVRNPYFGIYYSIAQ